MCLRGIAVQGLNKACKKTDRSVLASSFTVAARWCERIEPTPSQLALRAGSQATMGRHDRKNTTTVKDSDETESRQSQQQVTPQVQYVFLPRERPTPSFRADETDEMEAEEWAAEIRRYVAAKGMGAADGADFAISLLEGQARREVLSLQQHEINTAQKVCSAVIAAFGEQRTAAMLRDAFFSRRQGKREAVRDYGHALMTIKAKLQDKVGADTEAISSIEMIEHFVEGLQPTLRKPMRRFLLHKQAGPSHQSFRMVRDEAIRLEAEEQEETTQATAHIQAQEAVNTHSLQEQVAALSNTVAQLTMTITELRQQSSQQNYGPPRWRRGSRRANGQDVCFNCGMMGHFRRDCPNARQQGNASSLLPPANQRGEW